MESTIGMSFYGNKCYLLSDMLHMTILSFSRTVQSVYLFIYLSTFIAHPHCCAYVSLLPSFSRLSSSLVAVTLEFAAHCISLLTNLASSQ